MIRRNSFWAWAVAMVTVASLVIVPTIGSGTNINSEWRLGGQNLYNTRYQATEEYLSPANVAQLSPKWVFTTGGDISATPAVVDGAVYLPDWGGNLFKIDAQTGEQIWSNGIASYISDPSIQKAVSRTSPAVKENKVIIGTQEGAFLMAINKNTGELIWKTKLDDHPNAIITQSPAIYGNRIFVGVASLEEGLPSADPNYKCCTFRGSMTAVDLTAGKILWKTYTVPDNGGQPGGYSGGPIWGSTPSIDPKRNSVYVATGNNYNVPQTEQDCIANASTPSEQSQCLNPDNHLDSIMAFNLDTGAIEWARRLQEYDAFNQACFPGNDPTNCPDPSGEDYDFAQAPMLFTVKKAGKRRDLVGAAQKSGIFWALDPDTGEVVWSQIFGPSGSYAAQWGSATDGQQIYVGNLNSEFKEYTLQPSGETITGGSWSALDAATGKIIWQTSAGGKVEAPMTVANGVVYAGSMAAGPGANNMYALDAKTGKILWRFNSGGSVHAGAAVVNGTVYWGSGYRRYDPTTTPNNQFYALTVSP